MSLTTRLSAYFLTALALVLLGFSLVLYQLVRRHLYSQSDERLTRAAEAIVGFIEVHPYDVEWEPTLRHIGLGEEKGEDQVRWMLHDEMGRLIDCSRNLESGQNAPLAQPAHFSGEWHIVIQDVLPGKPQRVDAPVMSTSDLGQGIADSQLPGRVSLPSNRTHRAPFLTVRVGLPWHPVAASLWQLGWTLFGVSAGLWLVGALVSRWVCRRAIQPVVQMASCAKTLRGDQPGQLLPVAASGDELEALGHSFNDLLTRLQEVLQQQQRFAGDASHQLRTPLTAVLGQVEVALRQPRTPEEYQRVLQIVRRRAGEMRQTVELLLFLARMPARSEPPDTRSVCLASWLEEYQGRWEDHARARDIHWPTLDRAANCEVRTQPALLGQLVDNLLDNACKYSEAGTPIRLEIERTKDGVTLAVSDQGMGIPEQDLTHICDPFYRSAEARRRGLAGVGLGLTLVQRIVTVLGGELRIDSESGQGSRFSVSLPGTGDPGPTEKSVTELSHALANGK